MPDGKEGAWLGVRAERGESLTGTDEGVAKARDFRKKQKTKEDGVSQTSASSWVRPGSHIQAQGEDLVGARKFV